MQRRVRVCLAITALAAVVLSVALTPPARATVQDDEFCWDPDVEWPVPCDSDED